MSSPFDAAKAIREKYRDKAIALSNMVTRRMNAEKDERAKGAFAAVLQMMHAVGLLDDNDE